MNARWEKVSRRGCENTFSFWSRTEREISLTVGQRVRGLTVIDRASGRLSSMGARNKHDLFSEARCHPPARANEFNLGGDISEGWTPFFQKEVWDTQIAYLMTNRDGRKHRSNLRKFKSALWGPPRLSDVTSLALSVQMCDPCFPRCHCCTWCRLMSNAVRIVCSHTWETVSWPPQSTYTSMDSTAHIRNNFTLHAIFPFSISIPNNPRQKNKN